MKRWAILLLLVAADDPAAKAVEDALVAAEPRLHRCWEQAAAGDWRVEGKIDLKVMVGAGGKAGKVERVADGIGKPALAACVEKAFAGVTFAGFQPGDAVEVPVTFVAEPNRTVRLADAPLAEGKIAARVLLDARSAAVEKASLSWLEWQKGASIKPHQHADAEVVIVLVGSLRLPDGKTLGPGDVLYAPPGAEHGFTAVELSRILVAYTPPGLEAQFRPDAPAGAKLGARPAPAAPPTIARFADTTARTIGGGSGRAWMVLDSVDGVYAGRILVGDAVPEHAHAAEAEILYVLGGTGELTIDGQKYPIEPNMAVHIPPGAKHSFRVTSAGPVTAVQLYVPAGPEERFKKP